VIEMFWLGLFTGMILGALLFLILGLAVTLPFKPGTPPPTAIKDWGPPGQEVKP
jgi:hypothetical protein